MKNFIYILTLFLLSAGSVWASEKEVQQGQQYTSETRVRFSSFGVSFVLPKSWNGALSPDGEVFMLGSDEKPGLMLVLSEIDTSVDAIRNFLYQYIPIDSSITLVPAGQPTARDNRVTARYTSGTGKEQLDGRALAVVHDDGRAVSFFAIGPSEYTSYYQDVLDSLADSLVFFIAEVQNAPDDSWNNYLRGRSLTYYNTGSGYTEKRHLSLCTDGTFYY